MSKYDSIIVDNGRSLPTKSMSEGSADLNFDLGTPEKAQEIAQILSSKVENVSVTCDGQFISVHAKFTSPNTTCRGVLLPVFDVLSELDVK